MSKRDDILNTAERLFYRQGFHGTGIDQIVREAGVTPRTLYRHFPSKEQLVIAVLQQRETRFLSRLTRSADDARDDCLAIFDELEQWFAQEGEKGCLFLRALGEYSHKDTTITELALTHKRRELECLCRQLDDDTPERLRDRAESLMLILEGAVSRAPVIGGAAAAQQARQLAARLLAGHSG
ncbi:TetR/AcrR family transcriptional regulator [Oceanimonas sp. MB9]|uniref:TetR/AcrR family transcriptional regulator n=1 Tax=Oceanimonas sp. MB9 TaxID=2588453 RepID=UPI0013F66233|nr:TetR/AcrR family transcriptional regulator [Oceanimonas sp. MB9]NHI01702.1 putative HTH-type transcriptional regulator YxaF [Oceanimonas sp. MB9]